MNPLGMSYRIKSGHLVLMGAGKKDHKRSQDKNKEEISEDEHLLTGSKGHKNRVNLLLPFSINHPCHD
jgi:hypothetical protein